MVVSRRLRAVLLAGAALLSTGAVTGSRAKTLVYCAEGSPENFNPMLNTTGTSLAANKPIYSRLIDFIQGGPRSSRPWPKAGTSRRMARCSPSTCGMA